MSRASFVNAPLAIVGIACRFPGASDRAAFWQLLREGRDAVIEVPPERWNVSAVYDPDPLAPGKAMTRWGGFLEQKIDEFDPLAFGIAPREAIELDPQQRLALEVTWEALEDAGAARLRGTRTGVFMGALFDDYAFVGAGDYASYVGQRLIGQTLEMIAHRVSFIFGLEGPSLTVTTGCSSSLVALQIACQSVWYGDSDQAVVGAVGALIDPGTMIGMSKLGALSPDGRCKTFDARADGYVRSEGCGVLIVKTLARALRDGDPIHAVIRGSWMNNNGGGNVLTQPRTASQTVMLREAYASGGIDPKRVHYVELHGTGTSIGDPIEASALGAVLGRGRPADRPLLVGSVKTNLGHLEAAAGVAGIIKTTLAMEHREIPPSLHYQTPNPSIDLAGLGLAVAATRREWPHEDEPALAGVSSFGWGGTNAHVVLEESPSRPIAALLFAARDEAAARLRAGELAGVAERASSLGELVATIAVRPGEGGHRVGVVARSFREAGARLAAVARGDAANGAWIGAAATPKIAFACGAPAGAPARAVRLFATEPVFAAALRACDADFEALAGFSIVDAVIDGVPLEDAGAAAVVHVATGIALASQLRAWGIAPDVVVGEGVGELAAACIAGALARKDALRAALHAGRALAAGDAAAEQSLARRIEEVRGGGEAAAWIGGDGARREDAFDGAALARFVFAHVERVAWRGAARAHGAELVVELGGGSFAEEATLRTLGDGADPRLALFETRARLFALGVGAAVEGARDVAPPRALVLSARGAPALRQLAERMAQWLGDRRDQRLDDVCYTAAVRREAREHRLAVVGGAREEIVQALAASARGESHPSLFEGVRSGATRRLVWVYPGHGSQWRGMGRQLLAREPVFQQALEACDEAIRREVGWSVLRAMTRDDASPAIDRIDVVQPAIFAMQVALTALWRHRGLVPDAIVGHSLGEAAAAYAAGALDLDDAVKVICHRSRLAERARGQGGMALIELPADEAAAFVAPYEGRLCVAVCNSPRSTVVSGEVAAIDAVLAAAEARGVFCRRVKVEFASHSPQMDPLVPELVASVGSIRPRATEVPLYSTVLRERIEGGALTPEYWGKNLRKAVLFAQTIERIVGDGHEVFVEMSPHPILVIPVREVLASATRSGLVVGSLKRDEDEEKSLLEAAAQLHVQGRSLDWSAIQPEGRPVPLPAYPWQRQRFWRASSGPARKLGAWAAKHPLLEVALTVAGPGEMRVFEGELEGPSLGYLRDMTFDGVAVLPFSVFIEAALGAARAIEGHWALGDLALGEAVVLREGAAVWMQVTVAREGAGYGVRVATRSGDEGWTMRARAALRALDARDDATSPVATIRDALGAAVDGAEHYARMAACGVVCGASLRAIRETSSSEAASLARIELASDLARDAAAYVVHPVVLDAALQTLTGALLARRGAGGGLVVPTRVGQVRVHRGTAGAVWAHARLEGGGALAGSVDIRGADGELLAELVGVTYRATERRRDAAAHEPVLAIAWQASPLAHAGAPSPPARGTKARWLVLADRGGIAGALAARLGAAGEDVVVDPPSDAPAQMLEMVVRAAFPSGIRCRGVVSLATIDAVRGGDAVAHTLALVDAVTRAVPVDPPRFWIVTRGAQAVRGDDVLAANAPAQAAAWGAGRAIVHARPDLGTTRVDLAASAAPDDVEALARELLAGAPDEEIALRHDERYVGEVTGALLPASDGTVARPIAGRAVRLAPAAGGVAVVPSTPQGDVAADDVVVEVAYAAWSEADAERAASAAHDALLGDACVGRVVAVGERVRDLAIGDEVIAVVRGAQASHVTVPAALARCLPERMGAAEAVAAIGPAIAAWRAVHALARVEAGETVLVHGADTPLGAAVVDLVKAAGADVIVARGEAAAHAVIDALGELDRAVAMAANDGRIVTLVRGEGASAAIPVGELARRRLSLHALDVEALWDEGPEALALTFRAALGAIARGEIATVSAAVVPVSSADAAFRARRAHKATVVAWGDRRARLRVAASGARLRGDGAYLLVGAASPARGLARRWLEEQGATRIVQIDDPPVLADGARLAHAWRSAAAEHGQVAGVVYAPAADAELAPLLDVAHRLDALAREAAATLFVTLAGVASILGEAGQAPAAALGAALDALAATRRASGHAAAHVALGPIADRDSAIASRGVKPIDEERACALLTRTIDAAEMSFSSALAIVDVDGRQWMEARPQVAGSRFWLPLARLRKAANGAAAPRAGLREALHAADEGQRRSLLEDFVAEQTATVLRLSESDLDRAASLKNFGIDSVTGLEIRNRLEAELGLRLTATLLWTYPTIEGLAGYLATKLVPNGDENAGTSAPAEPAAPTIVATLPTKTASAPAATALAPAEASVPPLDDDEAQLEDALRAVASFLE